MKHFGKTADRQTVRQMRQTSIGAVTRTALARLPLRQLGFLVFDLFTTSVYVIQHMFHLNVAGLLAIFIDVFT